MSGLRWTDTAAAAALALLSLVAVLLLPDSWVVARLPFALLLALALPGAALTAAIGPAAIGTVERTTLAVGLSLSATITTSLLLHAVDIELTAESTSMGLAVLTIGASLVAELRGTSAPLEVPIANARRYEAVALCAAAVLLAIAVMVGRQTLPPPNDVRGATALWIKPLGKRTVVIGISSDAVRPQTFRLRIVPGGAAKAESRRLELQPGSTSTETVRIPAGSKQISALLLPADGNGPTTHRVTLHLPVRR